MLYPDEIIEDIKTIIKTVFVELTNELKSIDYVQGAEFSFDPIKLNLQYNYYAENGRGPGKQPPISEIKKWCITNGIKEEYAYPIAKNIAIEGTIGKYLISDKIKKYIK